MGLYPGGGFKPGSFKSGILRYFKNVIKVCFVILYQNFLVVFGTDFIVITRNILHSINDIPIVKPGISLY